MIVNEVTTLERARCIGHTDSAHAQHFAQKLVSQSELCLAKSISRHEQPARETGFDHVESITRGSLRDLRQQSLRMQMHKSLKSLALPELNPETQSAHPHRRTGTVNKRAHR